jgi:hypothetical protein
LPSLSPLSLPLLQNLNSIFNFNSIFVINRTSIAAQKLVDERRAPFKGANNAAFTHKHRDFSHFYVVNSSFKGKEEGCVNSFKSLRYYQNESRNYRDELLAEVSA